MRIYLLGLALLMAAPMPLRAATLDGVDFPDMQVVDGTPLRLNGIGLRTYSLFRIPIYIAALYLERRSGDGDAILRSAEKKLLRFHFVRDVDVDRARNAWREGLARNCKPPCRLDPAEVERFIAAVQPVRPGEESRLTFTSGRVSIELDGRSLGTVPDPAFASVLLASFIGAEPPTERLKRELLGEPP